jgi:hypothetical protein
MIAHSAKSQVTDNNPIISVNDYDSQGKLYVPNNNALCASDATATYPSAPCYITPNTSGGDFGRDVFSVDVLLQAGTHFIFGFLHRLMILYVSLL